MFHAYNIPFFIESYLHSHVQGRSFSSIFFFFFITQKIPANFIEILFVPETSSKLTFHSLVTWAEFLRNQKPGCAVSLGVAFPNVLIGKETLSSNKFHLKKK